MKAARIHKQGVQQVDLATGSRSGASLLLGAAAILDFSY